MNENEILEEKEYYSDTPTRVLNDMYEEMEEEGY